MKSFHESDSGPRPRCQTIFSHPGAARELELAERFRIQVMGFYQVSLPAGSSAGTRAEGEPLHQIELVISGRRHLVFQGRNVQMLPGQAWFFPGCTEAPTRCDDACICYCIRFRCEWLPGVDPLLHWPGRRPLCLGAWGDGVLRKLRRLGGAPGMKHLLLLQAQICGGLARALPDLEKIITDHVRSHSRFERVFGLMESRLGADLRVCDLAAVMNLPLSAFSMAFNRNVGMSPKAWLSRRLNQEAIRLLLESDVPTKHVAQQLKFSDEYHFSRFFKRLNGLAPTRYRQQFFDRRTSGSADATLRATRHGDLRVHMDPLRSAAASF